MRIPEITAIVDLQFGSTGKGSIAAWLGQYGEHDAVVHAWGPNAGHTSVYADGSKCIRTMVSNAAFNSPTIQHVFFGPGSMLNPEAVMDEIDDTELRGKGRQNKQYHIHESAAIVLEVDRTNEAQYGYQIGSTMKGTAEAVIRKMKRIVSLTPATMGELKRQVPHHPLAQYVVSHQDYLGALYSCRNVLAEGCQGYSLGINSGFWPHTTSRECTLPQLLSDTLLPMHGVACVIGTARTYPIRVANRFSREGLQIGTSGPCYPDQHEIDWADIGVEPELTTVTKLPRRVFTFSNTQIGEAIVRNSCSSVFLNFMNYLPEDSRADFEAQVERQMHGGCSLDFVGTGPAIGDIEPRNGWDQIVKDLTNEPA